MSDKLKDYEVTAARFIGGQHREVGDIVSMTEKAAKYYLPPHGAGLKVTGVRKEKGGSNVKSSTKHAVGKPSK